MHPAPAGVWLLLSRSHDLFNHETWVKVKKMVGTLTSTAQAGKMSSNEKRNGIVYGVYCGMTRGGATVWQGVLPVSLRKYVMSVAHNTVSGDYI